MGGKGEPRQNGDTKKTSKPGSGVWGNYFVVLKLYKNKNVFISGGGVGGVKELPFFIETKTTLYCNGKNNNQSSDKIQH